MMITLTPQWFGFADVFGFFLEDFSDFMINGCESFDGE